ncbi:hypothetical protein SanaruYs_19580 [Chryseotalea sanaruensis]|uniref:Fibrobacter succinogenes major paralogous domain-containing protein n=1 Tax=Chryseotalea sanaruensis TaxID=2482724 RepID=A0A401UA13_9BACT|nr:FISUMP domain-containing protein [Chryseotalea sanaruensis]GCC51729.1 hypothetical protein SanaruYs_19580 [Chryseotalea sanaruensis]
MFHNSKILIFITTLSTFISCKDDEPITPTPTSVTIENNSYPTITFGDQTWTIVNYAGTGGLSFDATNSKPEYGKYYTKAEVEAIILPEGWRLPTVEDFKKLAAFHNITIPSYGTETEKIKTLTSVSNWKNVNGTNTSKFNIYPTGYIFGTGQPLDGDVAEFWMTEGLSLSIQEGGLNMTSLRMVVYDSNDSPDYRFTVRFVKDN